ncbi:MAG: HAMP domain-containing histidine kinase [Ruminococcaceae bacterium]|nr:HAMP domain-containing histidine kinase [Oscillospiraceae bacterium]
MNSVSAMWWSFRSAVGTILILLATAAALIISAVAYGAARWKSRKIICELTDAMQEFVRTQKVPELPEKYAKIQKQMEQIQQMERHNRELAQTEAQRKNDLVTYLAHDLKTPLASVVGYLCLLDEAPDMPEAQKEKYTGIALQKAYRLDDLINEFFDITRFNLQTIELQKVRFDLAMLLRQLADEFYPMLTQKGITAAVQVPETLALAGDPDKLARVFNNILKNAVAYSYENSEICMTAEKEDNHIVVSVISHGEVIPLQKLDMIFEKFYRLDSSRSTHTGGAGLGLAIAKKIVTAHGGKIHAESSEEQTAFIVELPR